MSAFGGKANIAQSPIGLTLIIDFMIALAGRRNA